MFYTRPLPTDTANGIFPSQCDTQLTLTTSRCLRKRSAICNQTSVTSWILHDVPRCIRVGGEERAGGVGGGGTSYALSCAANPLRQSATPAQSLADSRGGSSGSDRRLHHACVRSSFVCPFSRSVRSYDFVTCGYCTFRGIKCTRIKFTNYWRI